MENHMEDKKRDIRQIFIFLIITFVLTYGIEIFLIAPLYGSADVTEAVLAQSMLTSVMFMPALGVVLTRILTKEGFRSGNLYFSINLKRNLKYYGIVWPLFAVLIIAGAALYFLVFPRQYDGDMGYAALIFNSQLETPLTTQEVKQNMLAQILTAAVFAPFMNIINCFGEEWGWRGYLLPKLLKRLKTVPAVLLDGVIWGIWHAPIVCLGHNYGTGYPGFPVTGILAMCVFCVVLGIILSYVTIKTNSCIPAVLGHGMINGFASVGVYFTSLENPYNVFLGPAPTGLIGGAGFIVLAAFLLFLLYREEKNSLHFDEQGGTMQKDRK